MRTLTTHVLDVAAGTPASGMYVELHYVAGAERRLLTRIRTNRDGRCERPLIEGSAVEAGRYALTFHVADYFRERGALLPDPPFLDEVVVTFGIGAADESCHVPLLVSPWSYSTYRGR